MRPRNAYKDMLSNVVSLIACVSMNHQNQLEQMTNGAIFATAMGRRRTHSATKNVVESLVPTIEERPLNRTLSGGEAVRTTMLLKTEWSCSWADGCFKTLTAETEAGAPRCVQQRQVLHTKERWGHGTIVKKSCDSRRRKQGDAASWTNLRSSDPLESTDTFDYNLARSQGKAGESDNHQRIRGRTPTRSMISIAPDPRGGGNRNNSQRVRANRGCNGGGRVEMHISGERRGGSA
jgi:hypothetical protein